MKGLKLVSLWGAQGYADATERLLAALAARGVPVTWHPMHFYGVRGGLALVSAAEVAEHPLRAYWHRPVDYDTVLFWVIPHPGLRQWVELEAGRRCLLATAWETDRLPADWPPLLDQFARVLVPSTWNAAVCAASGVRAPVSVVPLLTPAPGAATDPAALALPAGRFIFYSIGEWTGRKAFGDLLTAYWRAFRAADPVLLVLKTSRLDYTLATERRGLRRLWRWAGTARLALLRQRLRRLGPVAPVRLIDWHLSPAALRALHERGDCYVSLAHGEGWGLGAAEAASQGRPVIMPGYGGPLDFLPEGVAYHVPHTLVPARGGSYEALFTPEQRWAQADLNAAADLLRHVATHPAEARARGAALQAHFHTLFAQERVTDQLQRALTMAP